MIYLYTMSLEEWGTCILTLKMLVINYSGFTDGLLCIIKKQEMPLKQLISIIWCQNVVAVVALPGCYCDWPITSLNPGQAVVKLDVNPCRANWTFQFLEVLTASEHSKARPLYSRRTLKAKGIISVLCLFNQKIFAHFQRQVTNIAAGSQN